MRTHNQFSGTFPLIVDGSSVKRDLYLLVACALSSKRYAEQTSGIDYDALQTLRDSHEQKEIASLLLAIAVRIRMLDDCGQIPKGVMSRSCGSLTAGASRRKNKVPLTLREACNKIVHTRRLQMRVSYFDSFDATLPSPTSDHMEPSLLLHGTKDGKTWRASLDLVKFVRAIVSAPVVYED